MYREILGVLPSGIGLNGVKKLSARHCATGPTADFGLQSSGPLDTSGFPKQEGVATDTRCSNGMLWRSHAAFIVRSAWI